MHALEATIVVHHNPPGAVGETEVISNSLLPSIEADAPTEDRRQLQFPLEFIPAAALPLLPFLPVVAPHELLVHHLGEAEAMHIVGEGDVESGGEMDGLLSQRLTGLSDEEVQVGTHEIVLDLRFEEKGLRIVGVLDEHALQGAFVGCVLDGVPATDGLAGGPHQPHCPSAVLHGDGARLGALLVADVDPAYEADHVLYHLGQVWFLPLLD